MVDSLEIVIAACGALLLIAAMIWRSRASRQQIKAISRALVDADLETRKAALFMASEQGLGPYLQLLAERTRQETEEPVLEALMEVVLRNQWEPSDNRRLIELRLWAEARRAHASAAAVVASASVNHNGHVSPPAFDAEAEQAESFAERPRGGRARVIGNGIGDIEVDLDDFIGGEEIRVTMAPSTTAPKAVEGTGRHAGSNGNGVPREHPRSGVLLESRPDRTDHRRPARRVSSASPAPRRRLPTVIVTGAGGAAGVAVVRGLQANGHSVVAVDSDGLAAGLRLADESAIIPRSDDPTFIDALSDIIDGVETQMLIPTLTEELLALAGAEAVLEAKGVATWLPSPAAVEVCMDKWQFAGLLEDNSIAGPATNLGSGEGVPGAWVVKPRFGRGSRDVHFVDRMADLRWILPRVPEPIVQTRLNGREFTVDVLIDRDGSLAGAVPRWRLETKAGISTKGRTFSDDDLIRAVEDLLVATGLTGPANVQGCMAADGTPSFIEVNPRFSGGLPLSLAAGADLLGEYVRGIEGEAVRPDKLRYKAGVTMIRHLEEVFE